MTPTAISIEASNAEALKTKTVTLTFSTAAELDVYATLEKEATEDERSLNKYIVRKLRNIAE